MSPREHNLYISGCKSSEQNTSDFIDLAADQASLAATTRPHSSPPRLALPAFLETHGFSNISNIRHLQSEEYCVPQGIATTERITPAGAGLRLKTRVCACLRLQGTFCSPLCPPSSDLILSTHPSGCLFLFFLLISSYQLIYHFAHLHSTPTGPVASVRPRSASGCLPKKPLQPLSVTLCCSLSTFSLSPSTHRPPVDLCRKSTLPRSSILFASSVGGRVPVLCVRSRPVIAPTCHCVASPAPICLEQTHHFSSMETLLSMDDSASAVHR